MTRGLQFSVLVLALLSWRNQHPLNFANAFSPTTPRQKQQELPTRPSTAGGTALFLADKVKEYRRGLGSHVTNEKVNDHDNKVRLIPASWSSKEDFEIVRSCRRMFSMPRGSSYAPRICMYLNRLLIFYFCCFLCFKSLGSGCDYEVWRFFVGKCRTNRSRR